MQYKMVCLDIDGTLLNSEHKISLKTKKVIHDVAVHKKVPVILVSSRMPKGMLFLQKELDIMEPMVCYNGALIIDKDNAVLLSVIIPVFIARQVYDIAKALNVHLSIYKDDEWYIEDMDEWAMQESAITKAIPNIAQFNGLFNTWGDDNTGPNKFLCMGKPEDIKEVEGKLYEKLSHELNIYESKLTYLEINHKNASKTTSIDFLIKRFGIKKSEIIAIGDNYNDIDMLKYAGLGIAMGNAPDDVKKHADFVTSTNDEDGVACALKKFIFDE
ncbi:Cof-type HAD-IIB family hydrolase [Biomaibacter acetigenes]|uniref:Cof-type HAD-IIB family hydrolase n=1 Tax=Biomaibacter acetigenes TaxID=2316383 RepID=A0A3G2R2D9_9FIRM|nr:Cof-type HAD-IIB family hydrolase [Biomaibacter acetigenes]AYO29656.1 Cof-type HAD-IIB family hydrolase [Biomaibacter acetigenes]MDK2799289.1 hypothetical protein [Clostridiales bacterium]RKL63635.1 HAD family phosphatase [Thermoanaerobacteraceae bacterium SP2]